MPESLEKVGKLENKASKQASMLRKAEISGMIKCGLYVASGHLI